MSRIVARLVADVTPRLAVLKPRAMKPCIFCDIAAARAAADVVLSTPAVVGFLDARPVFKGHVLVVPRVHVETLPDLSQGDLEPLFAAVQRVARAVPAALGAEGTFVGLNNRVSQSVPHLHVHVVPRRKGDGLRGFFWPRQQYAPGEAPDIAARLRAALTLPA